MDYNLEKGKLPPQSLGFERAVLGALLLEKKAIDEVGDILLPEMFYTEAHKLIYAAIINLYSETNSVDMLTVCQKLRQDGNIEKVGGDFYIIELTQAVSSSAHIEYHARVIIQKYIQRQLINQSTETIVASYSEESDVFELLDTAYTNLNDISQKAIKSQDAELCDLIEAQIQHGIDVFEGNIEAGLKTPIANLTKKTGGWRNSELVILAARPGMGKGLTLNELVLTPNGKAFIKDLKIGDEICNTYGSKSMITGYFPQGERPVYEITFDDGLKVKADDQHLWEVQDRKTRKKSCNHVRVLSTKELLNEGLYVGNTNRKNFSIKYCNPAFHTKKELLIDPYILGCLLGDGYLSSKGIGFSNTENDILKKFQIYFKDKFINEKVESRVRKCDLYVHLEKYKLINKLSHQKFIPENYLYSNTEDRLNLLKGLLDTDGHIVTGNESQIEYSTTSEQLKDNIITLVRGLGGRCSFKERLGKYKKNNKYIETRLNYRIWITFDETIIPVSSEKHLSKYINKKQFHKRFITDIKYIGNEETVCIKVDSNDECFLMNDYLVTHNTAFVLACALHSAKVGIPVAIFSLEMNKEKLTDRLLSMEAKVASDKFNINGLSPEDMARVRPAAERLKNLPIHIDDNANLSIVQFQVKAKRLVNKFGIKMIVVDYLQLMSGDGKSNREQEISKISRGLKITAKELNIPIIALSQLSRSVEQRGGNKRPLLSDLRESGAIEQDADMVMFLYRPEYYGIDEWDDYDEAPTKNECEYIVAKNRNGGLVRNRMQFYGEFTLFSDLEHVDSFSHPDNAFKLVTDPNDIPF